MTRKSVKSVDELRSRHPLPPVGDSAAQSEYDDARLKRAIISGMTSGFLSADESLQLLNDGLRRSDETRGGPDGQRTTVLYEERKEDTAVSP